MCIDGGRAYEAGTNHNSGGTEQILAMEGVDFRPSAHLPTAKRPDGSGWVGQPQVISGGASGLLDQHIGGKPPNRCLSVQGPDCVN